ncbi:hypothetical protein MKJ01_01725 [Chryseobacterium sp. SSA4.19]|uniref:hypothetical protein n=1 Tax=Chryseobacterium sp. SSA4.19 TaxID=2919915 RepID=UPI001F4DE33C|nr:hypothetical protein [Chryseobacterium sp. SSA4.19]MCJ8152479.1 hypothetical protein [Chryseobacterium sp. SSA4.19]
MIIFSKVYFKDFLRSFGIFFIVCIGYYLNVVSKTDGHYVYVLDDAYIHLAMAKKFALYEVWGVTKYHFSSTSSSPLFTFLLSILIKVFGDEDSLPLFFNAIIGLGVVFILTRYFSGIFYQAKYVVTAVLFTLFFSVLHLQVLSGMEHVFHVFLFVLNIFCLSNLKNRASVFGFYFSLLLMGLVRFESMFYFVILALVFALLKKWKEALAIILVGFIPIAVFCYFNELHSGYLFPNSVVVKGTKFNFDSGILPQLKVIFLDNFLLNTSFYKIGLFPVIMSLIFIIRDRKGKRISEIIQDNFLLIILSLLMICHTMFADLKGFFRYEAYILAGFSMALIPRVKGFFVDFKNYIIREKFVSGLIIMNLLLLMYKSFAAHLMLDNGGKNIYEQQIQSARFLHSYYNDSKVVANDIGAITYYTDIQLLDIAGLASKETIPFNEGKRRPDKCFEEFLTQYTIDNRYDIAVIYDEWLQGHIPKNWQKAATLSISNPVAVSKDRVSVYSINKDDLHALKENIRKFSWNKNVKVVIID